MVDGGFVEHGWWAVGIVVCEFHGELEDEVCVGCVCGAVDGGGPLCHVFVVGEGRDAGRGLGHDVHEFLLEAGDVS